MFYENACLLKYCESIVTSCIAMHEVQCLTSCIMWMVHLLSKCVKYRFIDFQNEIIFAVTFKLAKIWQLILIY